MKNLTVILLAVVGAAVALPLMKIFVFPVQLVSLFFKPDTEPLTNPTFTTMISLGILLAKFSAVILTGYGVWRWSGRKRPPVALMGLLLGGLGTAALIRRMGRDTFADGYSITVFVFDAAFIALVVGAAIVMIFRGKQNGKIPGE